jgi:CHASE2 domain-containing sensor protein
MTRCRSATGAFNRELIGVAFHANSVDQALKRAVDFRARVGKLAALRSADR